MSHNVDFNESARPCVALPPVGEPDRARSSSSDSTSVSSTDEDKDREAFSKSLTLVSTSGSFDKHERGMGRGNREVEPCEGAGAPGGPPAAGGRAAGPW